MRKNRRETERTPYSIPVYLRDPNHMSVSARATYQRTTRLQPRFSIEYGSQRRKPKKKGQRTDACMWSEATALGTSQMTLTILSPALFPLSLLALRFH